MKVKIASISKSLIEEEELTAEDLLVYYARVSNPDNQLNTSTYDKLLRFLINKKHWSPFDLVNIVFEVKTSKAISIQILRHWSIKPQEFSQRYAEVTEIEPIEFRLQAEHNRQSSTLVVGEVIQAYPNFVADLPLGTFDEEMAVYLQEVASHLDETMRLYKKGIKLKIAKECTRMILPMASSTTLYLNGSVRSWLFYLSQRLDEHAQKEHQIVANEIEKLFITYFPNTHKAFFNAD